MVTVANRRPPVKPSKPTKPAAEHPPYEWLLTPTAGIGLLAIRGTAYRLLEVEWDEPNGVRRVLFKLRKMDGTEYQLTPDTDGQLRCDCADAIFRNREHCCKHVQAVNAAYAELDRRQQLDDFLSDDVLDATDAMLAADAAVLEALDRAERIADTLIDSETDAEREAREYRDRAPIPF